MAASCKVGQFSVGTATGTLDVTGVGFQPKVVIFWGAKPTALDTATAHCGLAFGVMDGTGQRCNHSESLDAQGSSAVGATAQTANAYYLINSGTTGNPSQNGVFQFSSWLADGFRINRTVAFDANYLVNYLAIGGTDITNVSIGAMDMPASTGSGAVSGLGYQPDALFLFLGPSAGAVQEYYSTIGVATRGSGTAVAHQACIATNARDASNTMQGRNHGGEHALAACQNTTDALHGYCDLTTFDSGGFSYGWTKSTTTTALGFYVAIRGGQWKSGSSVLAPNASTYDESFSVGFTPKMVMGASIFAGAAHTTGTDTGPLRFSVGAASGTAVSAQATIWGMDEELGTSDNATMVDQGILTRWGTATGFAFVDRMDLISFDATGFTTSWQNSASQTVWWWWIAAGDAATATTHELSGTVAGATTLAGEPVKSIPLDGTVAGSTTLAGTLITVVPLSGTVAGVTTLAGELVSTIQLGGTVAGATTLAGEPAKSISVSGTVAGATTLAGEPVKSIPFGGTIAGVSTLAGELSVTGGTVTHEMAGTIAGVTTVVGQLISTIPLSGLLAGSTTLLGDPYITVTHSLSGLIAGSTSVSGDPHVVQIHILSGLLAGSTSLSGELSVSALQYVTVAREGADHGAAVPSPYGPSRPTPYGPASRNPYGRG